MNVKNSQNEPVILRTKKQIGNDGELRAQNFFTSNGYKIVEANFRTRKGEIDFIACKDEMIVFVEVKTLPAGNLEVLQKELNVQKQKRIVETAKYFLAKHREYSNSLVRFDVVVIDMPGFDPIYHIENAFAEFS